MNLIFILTPPGKVKILDNLKTPPLIREGKESIHWVRRGLKLSSV
jgi:hypothetical protein